MDDPKLNKPAHTRDHIWRQHLIWMAVVGKQAEENHRQRKQPSEAAPDSLHRR